jgi:DNA-binding transcriptional MerR regulator
MDIDLAECRSLLRQPDGIDRLMAAGVPLHEIERLLDEADFEAACQAEAKTRSTSRFGRLLWT